MHQLGINIHVSKLLFKNTNLAKIPITALENHKKMLGKNRSQQNVISKVVNLDQSITDRG